MLRYLILLFTFSMMLGASNAVAQLDNTEDVINKSINLYNKRNFDESLKLLENVKNKKEQFSNWYYYYALNQVRFKNYDEALENFETYIGKVSVKDAARAYYYVGLIQFYKGDYEKALNSLELSLDVSTDPKLDKNTEALIDKTIRYQNYFEKSNRTNISFLLGYNLDSNTINLSPQSVTENVNGHVFNYGASASYKVIDRYSFTFEPSIVILDAYTLDSQFKANSTLQGTDALQILLTAPIRFYDDSQKDSNKYDISLNGYNIYLPLTTSTRELSLSSYSLKAQALTLISDKYSVKYGGSFSLDSSFGYTNDDDDASGYRVNIFSTLLQGLSDNTKSLFYDFGIDSSNTKGINTRYRRLLLGVGYLYPSFWSTNSSLRFGAEYLNYPDKTTTRTDNQFNLSYNISKELSETSNLLFNLRAVSNSSDSEVYKYSEAVIGVQYTKSIGF